ncbi:TROVE domain-containing protein [Chitinophaga sp. CF118]|uniref:TROVE domain-containing protein n=1 Tax=Chitinophaga sp. CF118 TaxID=1884367 RepID=UPI0008EBD232|nr:TROVE domain-containing protein [Chitinophaga sp. CF118]SFE55560.1 TROVE domain-containing protein [Chitinophaga sp. CF118]
MRFNILKHKGQSVINNEGAKVYKLTPEMELYSSVVTSALQDQFYEGDTTRVERIRSLITRNDPAYVAKLAIYARENMYLRSIPIVLAVELAKVHTGDSLVSKTVSRIVQRADEITELLSYYALANVRTDRKKLHRLSKQLQKGLSLAFNKFDEYQFAKYNRDTEISLRDALFLVHPKAKDETQQSLFNKIVDNELEVPYTWETALSAAGQVKYDSGKEKLLAVRVTWEGLIDSRKLGYMATMRNLRNMLENNISDAHVYKVCAQLTDETAVLKSKQLPFRFLAAYRELKKVPHGLTGYVQEALETALKLSVQNLHGFDNRTRVVIACDVSGSMQQPVSAKSKILYYDIGLMLGMLLQYKCHHVVSGIFGDTWKTVSLSRNSILSNVDAFYKREGEVGYSTNGYKVLEDLVARRYVADKIMLFTDCQMWDSTSGNTNNANTLNAQWQLYKKIAPEAKLYLFDLAGHGAIPLNIREQNVYLIAGWSDKVFEVMEGIDQGASAVEHIHAITV